MQTAGAGLQIIARDSDIVKTNAHGNGPDIELYN